MLDTLHFVCKILTKTRTILNAKYSNECNAHLYSKSCSYIVYMYNGASALSAQRDELPSNHVINTVQDIPNKRLQNQTFLPSLRSSNVISRTRTPVFAG